MSETLPPSPERDAASPLDIREVQQTTCCVVGGGPAGAVLSYLLARQGIPVTLLEAHLDFERDFRGDTLHPSIMEVMDELGLADDLLQLPHTKLDKMSAPTSGGTVVLADLSHLKTKFPYITFMPQARFLTFLTSRAYQFPAFHLRMGARVEALVEEGVVRGVRYRAQDGGHEIRAALVVGADGRFSRLRRLGGFEAHSSSPPMDVLWFRVSRQPGDAHGVLGRFGHGHLLVELEREAQWQLGFVIAKGSYQTLRAAGLEALRQAVAETAPELADRVIEITDWHQVSVLSVEADRLTRWYKPGLLMIGDAAHTMSPAGGNGINYAVMDAVATANILSGPLQAGNVTESDLARVQHRREHPTKIIQAIVNQMQERMIKTALDPSKGVQVPRFLQWPVIRNLPAHVVAFGIQPEHVKEPHHV
jgi:2-polyprenyl-6-methoxyphenol hydroxylase-like FAD-dependent oxidoreductase